ncbi:MAG: hypothetical protein HN737_11595 [Desulfobacterales bacterium]|jgi:hypothetical protein|nr:hypothetical protein [Desulfobacteraceae bacterium]MBT7085080.1 hypothetical protein [Desulfobacterales bacterium]MBT7698038.1 hypothetical protein [Desulfobacterales bacterium]
MRKLFFCTIGIIGLIGVFFLPNATGEGLSNDQIHLFNFLIRIAIINFSVIMFILPYLMQKGFIHPDYYTANRYEKARSEFFIISSALPGVLIFSYISFLTPGIKKGIIIFVLSIAAYRYFETIYILFKSNRKEE